MTERQEICDAVHELMRTRIGLVAPTALTFVSDEELRCVVGEERAEEGLAYDERTGRIYVPGSHLTATPADALLPGLAHEIRHAWQRDVAEGRLKHPLGDAERARLQQAFEEYDPFAPRWKMLNDPLQVDARMPFGLAYQGAK